MGPSVVRGTSVELGGEGAKSCVVEVTRTVFSYCGGVDGHVRPDVP
jgi:hypothetical protein